MTDADTDRVKAIVASIKPLAAEYYRITQKPLGVTGEIAEYIAADLLGLNLAPARTTGYDATRLEDGKTVRIQIKGRAFGAGSSRSQRLGKIKQDAPCDVVMLVLQDNATLDPHEIWEASFAAVAGRLALRGSKARERGALGVSDFIRLAKRVWPEASTELPDIALNAERRL